MMTDDAPPGSDPTVDRAALAAAAKRGELTSALLPLARLDRKHLATTLASLHQEGSVDALGAFSPTALDAVGQHDLFILMILYGETLPRIDADAAAVMTVTAGLVDRGGEDLMANEPYRAFRAWCSSHDARPGHVIALIESEPHEHGRFTRFALEAGATHDAERYLDAALRLVDHAESIVQLGALSALTTTNSTTQPDREDKVLATLQRQLDTASDPTVRVNALGALIERCLAAGGRRIPELRSRIEARPEAPSPPEQLVYAQALATHGASLPTALLDGLLARLHRLDGRHDRILGHIDMALSQHHDAFGIERVSEWFTAMLHESSGMVALDDFSSLRHHLRADGMNGLRDRLLFDALHKKRFHAGHEIASLYTEINQERTEVSLDVGSLGLSDEEIVALCRRATVMLVLAPQATLDLLLGALDAVGKGAVKAIGELLFEPVGLNYPETVRSELNRRDKRQTSSGRTVAAAVRRRIDVYLKGVQSARTIAELHPSTRERLAVRQREFRTMRDSHARAHEQSILAQLATPVHILYGNAVASYTPNDTAGQPARRQQMQFSSMSVSVEMPRLRSLDPTERLFGMQRFGED